MYARCNLCFTACMQAYMLVRMHMCINDRFCSEPPEKNFQ